MKAVGSTSVLGASNLVETRLAPPGDLIARPPEYRFYYENSDLGVLNNIRNTQDRLQGQTDPGKPGGWQDDLYSFPQQHLEDRPSSRPVPQDTMPYFPNFPSEDFDQNYQDYDYDTRKQGYYDDQDYQDYYNDYRMDDNPGYPIKTTDDRLSGAEILSDTGGWPEDVDSFPDSVKPHWPQGFYEAGDNNKKNGNPEETKKKVKGKKNPIRRIRMKRPSTATPPIEKQTSKKPMKKMPSRKHKYRKPTKIKINKDPHILSKKRRPLKRKKLRPKAPRRKTTVREKQTGFMQHITDFYARIWQRMRGNIATRKIQIDKPKRKKVIKTTPRPKKVKIRKPLKTKKPRKQKPKKAYIGQPDRFENADWPTSTSVMQGMLDFLSSPGGYLDNFQSYYAGGPVRKPHNYGASSYGGGVGSYGGGIGNFGLSVGEGGGGGGFLSGLIGDTSLSRQVRNPCLPLLPSVPGLCAGALHLVPARYLVPDIHLRHPSLPRPLHPRCCPRRHLRDSLQRDQCPELLGGRVWRQGSL